MKPNIAVVETDYKQNTSGLKSAFSKPAVGGGLLHVSYSFVTCLTVALSISTCMRIMARDCFGRSVHDAKFFLMCSGLPFTIVLFLCHLFFAYCLCWLLFFGH
jgi:hypothetical protein